LRPTITVLISPEGEIQLETTGFTGPVCETASRALIQALGLATHAVRTTAFYETVSSDQQSAASAEGSGFSPQGSVPLRDCEC
jgi:hypothetical protein